VLELGGKSAGNKDIAQLPGISTRTVETYVSNAMAKLGARSRAEALQLALQRGAIVPE
jgi:DNA-binding CsgD family transcriptional regulator